MINQIIPEDDAIYQCMAENSQGSILSRARLTVVMSEDRPSAPYNVHAETMSSSAILLAWERPLYNSDKVIAYSVHYMKAEGKQFDLNAISNDLNVTRTGMSSHRLSDLNGFVFRAAPEYSSM